MVGGGALRRSSRTRCVLPVTLGEWLLWSAGIAVKTAVLLLEVDDVGDERADQILLVLLVVCASLSRDIVGWLSTVGLQSSCGRGVVSGRIAADRQAHHLLQSRWPSDCHLVQKRMVLR